MSKVGVLLGWVLVVVVLSTVISTDAQAAKKKGLKPFPTGECTEIIKDASGEAPAVYEFRIKGDPKSLIVRVPCGSPKLPAYLLDPVCLELLTPKGKRILGPAFSLHR